ncbi:MAG: Asp-tRNA(Asn)/Glu-tRNA(Gln) amidotransferase subunit GatB [Burkholderiales bacterium]|nr:Asp-tRNA(Asn)/Glu-tRNA(Gln) amidotransferase subunit GatB [Burkholderiales bacterium]
MPSGWEVVIGLETHAQLSTASKIFSGSPTKYGAAPNTQASVVDLALPGTLPVLNKGAVECAIKFGLAVDAKIAPRSIFARKNYFYPDLPKGYQISQFELPVVVGGQVKITVGGVEKIVQLTRAHLEEDAGKSLHEGLETSGVSGIDLNRAGTPLLEIVTEPCMASAEEAVAYAKALHGIVTWIGICDGNMQEGSFRCDANVSVRRAGEQKLGTRAEIKNVNSFRFLEKAIQYEVRRQIEVIEDGGKVVQQTRLYDSDRDETRSMRSKEDAMDYRYFPDPDLLPVEISEPWIQDVRDNMSINFGGGSVLNIPSEMAKSLTANGRVSTEDARALTLDKGIFQYFQGVTLHGPKRDFANVELDRAVLKLCATFVIGEFNKKRNEPGTGFGQHFVDATATGRLLELVWDRTISLKTAKDMFSKLWDESRTTARKSLHDRDDIDKMIKDGNLQQVSDTGAIEKMVDDVIAANQKSVEEYKAGKEKALNALFGQVMKASNKTANPAQVTEILKRKLSS